jgi:hypothetical protein
MRYARFPPMIIKSYNILFLLTSSLKAYFLKFLYIGVVPY